MRLTYFIYYVYSTDTPHHISVVHLLDIIPKLPNDYVARYSQLSKPTQHVIYVVSRNTAAALGRPMIEAMDEFVYDSESIEKHLPHPPDLIRYELTRFRNISLAVFLIYGYFQQVMGVLMYNREFQFSLNQYHEENFCNRFICGHKGLPEIFLQLIQIKLSQGLSSRALFYVYTTTMHRIVKTDEVAVQKQFMWTPLFMKKTEFEKYRKQLLSIILPYKLYSHSIEYLFSAGGPIERANKPGSIGFKKSLDAVEDILNKRKKNR